MRSLSPLLLLLTLSFSSAAQNILARSEVGLTAGGMTYLGDLNNQSMFGKVNPALGLMARFNFDTRWSLSFGGAYGHLEGGNPDVIKRRNLSFRSPLAEGWIRVEFNFFPYGVRLATLKRSTPYIFCGFGAFKFNPMAAYTDPSSGITEWYALQPLGTEGQGSKAYPDRVKYPLFEVCMPFGIGYRWRLSQNVHLTIEYGWRKTWTDYLDDVSTTYVDPANLGGSSSGGMAITLADRSGEVVPGYVNAPGIKRGDDSLNDWYSFFNVSFSFSAEMLFGWMRGKVCEK